MRRRSSAANASRDRRQRYDPGDERAPPGRRRRRRGRRRARSPPDGRPGRRSRCSSRQKNRCRSTSRGAGMDRRPRPAGRARPARRWRRRRRGATRRPRRRPSAPAPPVHSRHTRCDVDRGRVEHRADPSSSADPTAVGVRPRAPATSAPPCAGDDGDQEADRSAADDDDLLAALTARARPHVVHGHGGGLDQGGVRQRQMLAAGGRACGAGTVQRALHRAGGVDADEGQAVADVRVTRRGRRGTSPHQRQRHDGDRVADRPAGHPVTDARRSGRTSRVRSPPGRPTRWSMCAVQDVQVGAADAGVGHLDPHLARAAASIGASAVTT